MEAGGLLEAPFTLQGRIDAGSWHLIGDGIPFYPVDREFDVILRVTPADGSPPVDTMLATWTHHFDPLTGAAQFDAVVFEADADAPAAPAAPGDQLVLRFVASNAPAGPAFIPNSHGSEANGRIPSLTLPP